MPLKIATITDYHHGPDNTPGTKLGTHALSILAEFKDFCDRWEPDLVLDMGDRINDDVPGAVDLTLASEVAAAWTPFTQPREHLMGNHDWNELTPSDWATLMPGQSFDTPGFSYTLQGHKLVFFNPVNSDNLPRSLSIAELSWLSGELASPLPTIICTHIPLHRHSPVRNSYADNGVDDPGIRYWAEANILETMLRDSHTVLVLTGHTHWNHLSVQDDIAYVTIASATEAANSYPNPSRAFGLITVYDTKISVRVRGLDPTYWLLKKRVALTKWKMQVEL